MAGGVVQFLIDFNRSVNPNTTGRVGWGGGGEYCPSNYYYMPPGFLDLPPALLLLKLKIFAQLCALS